MKTTETVVAKLTELATDLRYRAKMDHGPMGAQAERESHTCDEAITLIRCLSDVPPELAPLETALPEAQRRCSVSSGMPGFPAADRARAALLAKIATMRPLTSHEVIQLTNPEADPNPFADEPEPSDCPGCGQLIDGKCPTCEAAKGVQS